MPIPRLQRFGPEEDRFLYEYGWTEAIRQGVISAYQRGQTGVFDNRLLLRPGVAAHLIALTGILRPVIRREWTLMVAAMNELPQVGLERFLFGADRVQLHAVRGPLRELQGRRCFYCLGRADEPGEVDHFIPWARYADDSLDNLVVAHRRCNGQKRDFFADVPHLERWLSRHRNLDADLQLIATTTSWPREKSRSLAVTRAMYSRLPGGVRLWVAGDELALPDRERIQAAFAT